MNSIKRFDPRRFLLLIRNDLFMNRYSFLIFLAAAAGALLFLKLMGGANNSTFYQNWYFVILFVIGLNKTEKIFKGMHDDVKGPAWLTLPASTLEKFSSRALFLTVVFSIGLMAFFFLMSLTSEALNRWLIGSSHLIFNPFEKKVLVSTYVYIILQSLFMLGAIYFKKSPGIKTFLSLIIYVLVFVIIAGVAVKIFFGGSILNFAFAGNPVTNVQELVAENDTVTKIWSVIRSAAHFAFWYVLAPLCWIVGYIRLREKEV
jgi:hypothetical protein